MAVLQAFDLYRFYHAGEDETLALRGVSLQLAESEFVAIMGPSGSGKSTLLACLAGIDEPDGGYVTLMGRRLTRRSEAARSALRAAHIGSLLQNRNLFEYLTVEDNVRLRLHLAGAPDRARVRELLAKVGLLARASARPSHLSGGEAARAGLAVALAADPPLVIADEPTAEVDGDTEERLLSLLRHRRERGGATLVATHSEALAARADRVIRLHDGRILDA